MKNKKLIYFLIVFLVFLSCTKEKSNNLLIDMDYIKNVPQNKWDELSQKKIYFGHQSVGYNMIDGLIDHLKNNPNIKLTIAEGNDLGLFDQSVFAHSTNGKNEDPKSKIDAFYNIMDGGVGNLVDMAGFKFCYLDFKNGTEVDEVFKYYRTKMHELSLKYPNVKIIHYTVPLKTIQSGPKAIIKKMLGKSIGIEDNLTRQKFNTLLLNEYANESLFDLAKFESTYPDGSREFIEKKNDKIYSLIEDYTNDGGHLSKEGQYYITTQFLLFLAEETATSHN